VDPHLLEAYGAFDISVVSDLPLFVDPCARRDDRRAGSGPSRNVSRSVPVRPATTRAAPRGRRPVFEALGGSGSSL